MTQVPVLKYSTRAVAWTPVGHRWLLAGAYNELNCNEELKQLTHSASESELNTTTTTACNQTKDT